MKVLAITAHPDDAELLCGGTLAKYAERGDEVAIAIATNGEVGSSTMSKEETAKVRRSEAEAAAEIIGADLFWLGFPDEFLLDSKKVRLAFIDVIREVDPDVILTHWPDDLYNPDHSVTGQVANDVALMVTVPNIKTEADPIDEIPIVYFIDSLAGIGFNPDEYVEITGTIDTKKEMLKQHESQLSDWLKDQYGVNTLEMLETVARFRGIQSSVPYAEGFIRAKAWPRNTTGTLLPID